ncbi:MAG: hypothetical protein V4436_01695, partial [Patescibacteria group bacterium]
AKMKASRKLPSLFDAVRGNLEPSLYHPDLYIFLDLPSEVAYARRNSDATQAKSKFDIKPVEYHERTREGFKAFGQIYGPAQFVNAERSPKEIHDDIWDIVSRELGL